MGRQGGIMHADLRHLIPTSCRIMHADLRLLIPTYA